MRDKGKDMNKPSDIFKPLINQLVWSVHTGDGSFLTMEFGNPHLSIREPITPNPTSSERVRRNLKRRKVFLVGDWHFWIKYSDWKLFDLNCIVQSVNHPNKSSQACLDNFEGQRLISINDAAMPGYLELKFDLGGTIEVWPSSEIEDDRWSLYNWNGDIVTCRSDGSVVFEKNVTNPKNEK